MISLITFLLLLLGFVNSLSNNALFAYDTYAGYVRIEPQSGKQFPLHWNTEPASYVNFSPAQSGIFTVDESTMSLWFLAATRDAIVEFSIYYIDHLPTAIPLPPGKEVCQLTKANNEIYVLMDDGSLYSIDNTTNSFNLKGSFNQNPLYLCSTNLVFDAYHNVIISVWYDEQAIVTRFYGYHVQSNFFFELPQKNVPYILGMQYIEDSNGMVVVLSNTDYGAVTWSPLTESWNSRKMAQFFGVGYDVYECGIASLSGGDVYYILNNIDGTFYLYGFNYNTNTTFPSPVVCGGGVECPFFLFSL